MKVESLKERRAADKGIAVGMANAASCSEYQSIAHAMAGQVPWVKYGKSAHTGAEASRMLQNDSPVVGLQSELPACLLLDQG